MTEYYFTGTEEEHFFIGKNYWSTPWSCLNLLEPYIHEYNISSTRDSYVININGELVDLNCSHNNLTTSLNNNQTSINYLYPIFMDKFVIGEYGLNIRNKDNEVIILNISDDQPITLRNQLRLDGKPAAVYIFSKSGFNIEELKLLNIPKLSLIAADFRDYFGESNVYEYDKNKFNEQKFYKNLNATTILGNIKGEETILELYTSLNNCSKSSILLKDYYLLINNDSNNNKPTSPLNYSSCDFKVKDFKLEVPDAYKNLYFSGNLNANEARFITSGPLLLNDIVFNITSSLNIGARELIIRGLINAGNFTLTTEYYCPITSKQINIEGDFHWEAKSTTEYHQSPLQTKLHYGNIKGTFSYVGGILEHLGDSKCAADIPYPDGFKPIMFILEKIDNMSYGGLNLEIHGAQLGILPVINVTGPVKIQVHNAEIIVEKLQSYGEVSLISGKKISVNQNTEIMALGNIKLQAPTFTDIYGLYRSNQAITINSNEELKVYGKFQALGDVIFIVPRIYFFSRAVESEQTTTINVEHEVHLGQNSKIQTKDLVITKADGTRTSVLSLHSASIEVRNNAIVKANNIGLAPYNLAIEDEIYATGFQHLSVYRNTPSDTHVECHREKPVFIRSYIDIKNDFTVDTQSFYIDKSNVYVQGKIEFINAEKANLDVKGQAFYKWGVQWSDGPDCYDGGTTAINLIREKCGIEWHWTVYWYGDYVCGIEAAKARLQSPTSKHAYYTEHGSFIGVRGIYGNFNQISIGDEGALPSNFEDTHFRKAGAMLGNLNSNGLAIPQRATELQGTLQKHLVMLDPNRKVENYEQVVRPLQGLNRARFESNDYIANPHYSLPTPHGDSSTEAYDYFYTLRYQPLKSCNIGIDYILKQLDVSAESVGKIFCESNCQLELVKGSLEKRTGFRDLSAVLQDLRDYFKEIEITEQRDKECLTIKYLLDNAVEQKASLGAIVGEPISESVLDKINKPFIWPVYENYEGFKVLAPAVYFPKDLLNAMPTRHGSFFMGGNVDIKANNILSGGGFYVQEGSIEANNVAIVSKVKKTGAGTLVIEADNILIASMMHTQITKNGFNTERLTHAGVEATEGELVLLIKKDLLLQGAKIKGKIVAEVGIDIIAVPAKMVSTFEHYDKKEYIRFASLQNVLNTFEGDITLNSKGKQYYEGAVAEGGSTINFSSEENSIELVIAVDKYYYEHQKTKERVFSDKTTTRLSYHETAKGNQLGELINPLKSLTIESYGNIALTAAKIFTKKLHMEAGINNPEKAQVIITSADVESFQQTTVERDGFGCSNGMCGSVSKTTITTNSQVTQEPSVIVIVGDPEDETDNTAFIITNGEYKQISSQINYETGKLVIIAPDGITIGAKDNEIINIVYTSKEVSGIGFSGTKEEVGVKAGIEIRESYNERVKFTPVQSSIKAQQLELHAENGYLHTRGAILTYKDALIKGLGHIDEPAEQKTYQLNKEFKASLHLKIGLRSSLSNAIDSTKEAFDSNVDTPEGIINTAFKAYGAFVNWVKFITMPVQGGMYIHGKMKKDRLQITYIEPVVSEFTSYGTTAHETDKIYLKGTKIVGYRWYVTAKDVHMTAAFSSYEEVREGSSGEIIIPLTGGIIPSLSVTPISKSNGKIQNYHMLQVMMADEVVFDVGGAVNIEGGYMEADNIIINAKSLVLKSVQRLAESKSHGFTLSGSGIDLRGSEISFDNFLSGGGGYYSRGETKWIDELAGIVGKKNLKVVVKEVMKVAGAVVANAERNADGTLTDKGKLYIKAAEVVTESIYGYNRGKLLGASYSSGGSSGNSFIGNSYGAQFGYTDLTQEVKAGLGDGIIEAPVNGKYARNINDLKEEDGIQIDPIYAQYTQVNWEGVKQAFSEDGQFSFAKVGEHMTQSIEESFANVIPNIFKANKEEIPTQDLNPEEEEKEPDEEIRESKEQKKESIREVRTDKSKPRNDLHPDEAKKQRVFERYVKLLVDNGVNKQEAKERVAQLIIENEHKATKTVQVAALPFALVVLGMEFISGVILAKVVGDKLAEAYPKLKGAIINKIIDIQNTEENIALEKSRNDGHSSKVQKDIGGAKAAAGAPDPDNFNDDNDPEDNHRFKWEVKDAKDADKISRHEKFGKFYRDPEQTIGNKRIWWSKDTAEHGGQWDPNLEGSRYKLFVEYKKELRHIACIDKNGNVIPKHKSPVGEVIYKKDLIGIK